MERMYLPSVEKATPRGWQGIMIKAAKFLGFPVPQILHLFAYKSERTKHWMAFTQDVMRGPSPLSPGQREAIAALVSRRNDCLF
jgi:alkylhydroperoxidase family enzyme